MNASLRGILSMTLLAALGWSACTCQGPGPTKSGLGGGTAGGSRHPDLKLVPVPSAPQVQAPLVQPKQEAPPLTVVVARPTGEVFNEVRPTITFSKPVMALGTVEHEQGQAPVATITPDLAGEWRWLGSASVEFVPKGLVPVQHRVPRADCRRTGGARRRQAGAALWLHLLDASPRPAG